MNEKFKMIANISTLVITLAIAVVGVVGNYLDRGEEKADRMLEVMKVQIKHTEDVQKALSEDVEKLQDALLMLGMQSLTAKKEEPAPQPSPAGSRRRPSGRRSSSREVSADPLAGLGLGGGGGAPGDVSAGPAPVAPAPESKKEKEKKEVQRKLKLGSLKSTHVQQRPMIPAAL